MKAPEEYLTEIWYKLKVGKEIPRKPCERCKRDKDTTERRFDPPI